MADPAPHHDPLASCPNCDTPFDVLAAAPRFCPHCGQETVLHPPSVAEFAHEFVGHYVALEGALWRTLRLLLLRPGQLTKEYLAGRRQRYVLPLRLYLSASFLFFLAAKFMPDAMTPNVSLASHAAGAASQAAAASLPGRTIRIPSFCGAAQSGACSWFERRMDASRTEFNEDPHRAETEFRSHFLGRAPYALFFMLPFFAGVLAVAYRGRRMLFGEHLVFSMHLTAFAFLASVASVVLPEAASPLILAAGIVYAVLALHTVYGGSWAWTIVRSAVMAAVYGILLLLLIVFMSLFVLFA
jgi:hypothetical protein